MKTEKKKYATIVMTHRNKFHSDDLYAEWFKCPKCGFAYLCPLFRLCPNCGKEIKWKLTGQFWADYKLVREAQQGVGK